MYDGVEPKRKDCVGSLGEALDEVDQEKRALKKTAELKKTHAELQFYNGGHWVRA